MDADPPLPLTDSVGCDIWLAALEAEYGLVIAIPDPSLALSIRDRLHYLRLKHFPDDTRITSMVIHIPPDCRSLTIKPRLANVLP